MTSESDFDRAFNEVSCRFPFKGYVNSFCYFELRAIVNALKRFIPDFNGLSLLDVGCGPMDKTAVLQKMGFRCKAIDDLSDHWHKFNGNTQSILEFAKTSGIDFFQQSEGNYSIPFEKNYFDVVTSIAVIEHLHETPRLILNAMGGHLKPGGLLVVVMPNSVNLRKRISVLLGRTNYPPIDTLYYSVGSYRGHVREYTLAETQYICTHSGFRVVHAGTFEHLAQGKLSPALKWMYLFAGNIIRGFRSGIIVIAEKPHDWKPVEEDMRGYIRALEKAVPEGVLEPVHF